jgi:predicted Zn-dependent protease
MLEGMTLMDLKRPHQAAEVLLTATHRGPPSADLLCTLAKAQSASGKPAEATSAVQQALAVDSSHQQSRELLAHLNAQAAGAPQRR